MNIACKPRINIAAATSKQPYSKYLAGYHVQRSFATQQGISNGIKPTKSSNTSLPRKQVTVLNDDGRVPWMQLTAREKVARTTQQSFNAVVVLAGVLATVYIYFNEDGAVITFLYWDVFSPDSKTSIFNRAVDRIKRDKRCLDILGNSNQISAYGEGSWSRWARNRFIASRTQKDKLGNEHIHMHFNVEGPLSKGVVRINLTKQQGQSNYEYQYLALDVPGHQRIYLEKALSNKAIDRSSGKLFGIRWW